MTDARGYAAVYQHATDAVLLTATDGRILAANPAACRLLRSTEAQICDGGRDSIVDHTDSRWPQALATRAATGHVRAELRMRRGDGTTVEVDATSSVYDSPEGPRSVVIMRDLSALSRRLTDEAHARRAATVVVDTLDAISDGFFSMDSGWVVTYFNRRAEEMTGVSRDVVVGRHLMDAFPGVRGEAFEHHYTDALATGRTAVFRSRYGPLGLDLEVRAHPLPDGGLAVYFLDAAQSIAAERERETLLRAERAARASAEASRRALAHRATHDVVTGLLNRAGLDEAAAVLAARAHVGPLAVLFVDLDNFKLVNDTLGHSVGDEALRAVALRLLEVVAPEDVLARFGGDEFVVVVPGSDAAAVELLAEQVVQAGRRPLRLHGRAVTLAASVGIAMTDNGTDVAALLRQADTALAHAKESGRSRWAWYDDALHRRVEQRVAVEDALRTSLADGGAGFSLAYQPAYDVRTGRPAMVEALARWEVPGRGQVPPGEFIPVAEATGLIVDLGEVLLNRAMRRARAWHDDGVRTWVNVSRRQLVVPGLVRTIAEALDRHHCPAAALGIEITETALADPATTLGQLTAVADLGVGIALDDFGVGYSSFAALADVPLDVLKIDRSFVARSCTAKGDAVLTAVVNLGRALGATVVAEGIETAEQLHSLRSLGCDAVSGFYLTRPGAAPDRWAGPHPEVVAAPHPRRRPGAD